jgi:hypothetical protein
VAGDCPVAHQVCVLSGKYSCFGLTCEARVATLIEHPASYLAIGGGGFGESFNKI